MVASIGKIASPAQGVSYFEKDGYYAKDDAAHREASAWAGKGAAALGLSGLVEPEAFQRVLEGEVPGGRRLGRKEMDGTIHHRPGRDVTLSARSRSRSWRWSAAMNGSSMPTTRRSAGRSPGSRATPSSPGCATRRPGRWSAPGNRRWRPRRSAMIRPATSTRSSIPIASSPTWSRAATGSGGPWSMTGCSGSRRRSVRSTVPNWRRGWGSSATGSRRRTRTGASRSRGYRASSSKPSRRGARRSRRRWRSAASARRATTRSSRIGRR